MLPVCPGIKRDEPDFRTDKDIQNDTDEKSGTGRGQLHYWMVFNFYAGFIQYLVNRNIKFELYYSKKGKNWKERLNLALLCRQLGSYRRAYEKKLRSA